MRQAMEARNKETGKTVSRGKRQSGQRAGR